MYKKNKERRILVGDLYLTLTAVYQSFQGECEYLIKMSRTSIH